MGGGTPPPEMENWFPVFPWKGPYPPQAALHPVVLRIGASKGSEGGGRGGKRISP